MALTSFRVGQVRLFVVLVACSGMLLAPETVAQVTQLTKGRDLVMLDDMLNPVENPGRPRIARILPADAAFQVVRAACTLGLDASEVLAEVANAASRSVRLPKASAAPPVMTPRHPA